MGTLKSSRRDTLQNQDKGMGEERSVNSAPRHEETLDIAPVSVGGQ
jgi:hypothetical protein